MSIEPAIEAVKILVDTFNAHNIPYQFIGATADTIYKNADKWDGETVIVQICQSDMDLVAYLLRKHRSTSQQFDEIEGSGIRGVNFRLKFDQVDVAVCQLENCQIKTKTGWQNLPTHEKFTLKDAEVRVWQNLKVRVQPYSHRENIKDLRLEDRIGQ